MEISSRVLLRTGLQIVGVITIITGICHTIATWGSLPSSRGMLPMGALVISILIPLFILAAGIFLLIGTKSLTEKLYPDEEEKPDSSEHIFSLAMKITGMVLIVQALPDAVQILSSLIYIKASSPVLNNSLPLQFIYTELVSTLLYFTFGWYLLKGGQMFVRLAFNNAGDEDNNAGQTL
ncbi:MAG: hypothetical protein VB084_16405 [Syntrophomonadaceae bacterium]|nr:hypothetical protein [Syntrophomonadaceae bacterium]